EHHERRRRVILIYLSAQFVIGLCLVGKALAARIDDKEMRQAAFEHMYRGYLRSRLNRGWHPPHVVHQIKCSADRKTGLDAIAHIAGRTRGKNSRCPCISGLWTKIFFPHGRVMLETASCDNDAAARPDHKILPCLGDT